MEGDGIPLTEISNEDKALFSVAEKMEIIPLSEGYGLKFDVADEEDHSIYETGYYVFNKHEEAELFLKLLGNRLD